MTQYIERHLGLERDAANRLRREYWQRYGATLLGLMRHHGTDPRHFLLQTHQFADLERLLVREPGLRRTLRRLPGRKFVFSNAPTHYTGAVLAALGIRDLFDGVFCIEHTRFRPKPDAYGFLRLCRLHHLKPRRCIMVEDTLQNLRTAARLGMKTVWVTKTAGEPSYVNVAVTRLMQLRRKLAYLQ
jgi:putative hydrolase of the HAD superfamily